MLQVIGLIVAIYVIARLCQVPFEHAAYNVHWMGLPFWARSVLVCIFSAGALLLLIPLLLVLLFGESPSL